MVQTMLKSEADNLRRTFISTFTNEKFLVNIVRTSLYPADYGSIATDKTNSIVEYMKSFLGELSKTVSQLKLQNNNVIQSQIKAINSILNIRESGSSLITYDNVMQHLVSRDLVTTKLIQSAVQTRIDNTRDFRQLTDEIINMIHAFYEIDSVKMGLDSITAFQSSVVENSLTPFEALKDYKEVVINAYNDLSNLQSLTKAEKVSDYFVLSDNNSCEDLAETLVSYISSGYSVFRTGYDLLDLHVEGVESASVHVITAPSNHGKSLFMVNLCRNMIEQNISDFKENDCVVFVTLEDDIYKLSRRFTSICGNIQFDVLKELFRRSYEITRANQLVGNDSSELKTKLKGMYKNVLSGSIAKSTKGRVNLIVKHSNENTFSPGDLGRFIDRLKVDGLNAKLVFVDYIDVMAPTVQRYTSVKDYDLQGQVVQELRNFSRIHGVPVITATQNNKLSENVTQSMNNTFVGDSYKKVRYSDFIYMCRMRGDLSFLAEAVKPHVFPKDNPQNITSVPNLLSIKDKLSETLVPFEVKITKAKDSGRDQIKFMLFCKENLRIYNTVQEYLDDSKIINHNSKKLQNDIRLLSDLAISSISDDSDLLEASDDIPLIEADGIFEQQIGTA